MAFSILKDMSQASDSRCVHVCGRYHVEHFLGVVEHLNSYLEMLEEGAHPMHLSHYMPPLYPGFYCTPSISSRRLLRSPLTSPTF